MHARCRRNRHRQTRDEVEGRLRRKSAARLPRHERHYRRGKRGNRRAVRKNAVRSERKKSLRQNGVARYAFVAQLLLAARLGRTLRLVNRRERGSAPVRRRKAGDRARGDVLENSAPQRRDKHGHALLFRFQSEHLEVESLPRRAVRGARERRENCGGGRRYIAHPFHVSGIFRKAARQSRALGQTACRIARRARRPA